MSSSSAKDPSNDSSIELGEHFDKSASRTSPWQPTTAGSDSQETEREGNWEGGATEANWQGIASNLLDSLDRPTLVIHRSGRILLANFLVMERFGWERSRVVGTSCDEIFGGGIAWPLQSALAGALKRFSTKTTAADGTRYRLLFELDAVGASTESRVLLAKILQAQRDAPVSNSTTDTLYTISVAPMRLGLISEFSGRNKEHNGEFEGKRCYAALHNRDTPCTNCPAFNAELKDEPLSRVVHSNLDNGSISLVTAIRTNFDSVHLRSQELSSETVSDLIRAKVDSMAERGGLTERETSVLNYLLLGRTAEDIGAILGISPRTVKFHQSNMLKKLNAESRVDLFRLLL